MPVQLPVSSSTNLPRPGAKGTVGACVGASVGESEGANVSPAVVGPTDGCVVGAPVVGDAEGASVSPALVGCVDGVGVGSDVGSPGVGVGCCDGSNVGSPGEQAKGPAGWS
jgi:hypothetical protein